MFIYVTIPKKCFFESTIVPIQHRIEVIITHWHHKINYLVADKNAIVAILQRLSPMETRESESTCDISRLPCNLVHYSI